MQFSWTVWRNPFNTSTIPTWPTWTRLQDSPSSLSAEDMTFSGIHAYRPHQYYGGLSIIYRRSDLTMKFPHLQRVGDNPEGR